MEVRTLSLLVQPAEAHASHTHTRKSWPETLADNKFIYKEQHSSWVSSL